MLLVISAFPKIIMLVLNIMRVSCGASSNLIQTSKTYLTFLGWFCFRNTFNNWCKCPQNNVWQISNSPLKEITFLAEAKFFFFNIKINTDWKLISLKKKSNIVKQRQEYLISSYQKGTRHQFAADTFLPLHKTRTDLIQYSRKQLLFATTPTNHCMN